MITRRALLGAVPVVAMLPPAYAIGIEPYAAPRIARYALAWPGPRLTIAALADLHAGGSTMTEARIAAIVAATNALAPDLIVLLGDYGFASLLGAPLPQAVVAGHLAGLRASLGTHAVLGNHDWWEDGAARRSGDASVVPIIARELAGVGIGVLRNAARRFDGFWLAGLDSQWAFGRSLGAHDLGATLAAMTDPAPAILLAHEPDSFAQMPRRFDLTLSGHTHGGQVSVAGRAPFVPSLYGQRYRHGLIVEDERRLIVSAGLGTTFLPVRFNVPPEIVLVTLGT
ncbi:metallophosphoesterase [Plastoroseomonas arctica]|uniref:Metallophosphoesterase n=1 Tax=Plastoroseomonas arctica TaxID=1509237 RepID=A0AAF1KIR8_9PROT|nr:metallophosphoesterase [Plastoroseomonas arctica]MBR0654390.1 metallophosphoesterase [Plastoroseomonas arctica]